jgi:UDP-glucuronate 4-epimerase
MTFVEQAPTSEPVLVTGAAGFIGYHVAERLLAAGWSVVGLDNLNSYYEVQLKRDRLARLQTQPRFRFEQLDLADRQGLQSLFQQTKFAYVVHLGAQAGVRYAAENPQSYVDSNLVGFLNILEGCRHQQVAHLVYASSSSVYGANTRLPFRESDTVDHPVSLYAATKKANELMAHSYSHLYQIPTTGLRFFTVYGPWGRPDMALFKFTRAILAGEPIAVYNYGRMRRDFTYVDDVVTAVVRVMQRVPQPDPNWSGIEPNPATSLAPYRVYNIGNHEPVDLLSFIEIIEACLGRTTTKELLPLQPGDVLETFADCDQLHHDVDFQPSTPLAEGIRRFTDWYLDYYGIARR